MCIRLQNYLATLSFPLSIKTASLMTISVVMEMGCRLGLRSVESANTLPFKIGYLFTPTALYSFHGASSRGERNHTISPIQDRMHTVCLGAWMGRETSSQGKLKSWKAPRGLKRKCTPEEEGKAKQREGLGGSETSRIGDSRISPTPSSCSYTRHTAIVMHVTFVLIAINQ